MKLETEICGIPFKNPLIMASGTYGFGREFDQFYDISQLGGIAVKGLTLLPREGNLAPRMMETSAGMLNAVGLQNPGVDDFLIHDMPWLAQKDIVTIANIAGNTIEEYCQMAEKLANSAIHMIELNISCPNVKQGGVQFGVYPEAIATITKSVKRYCKQPLMVKLSPNVANIAENARVAQEAGADALSLINTVTGMAINARTRLPVLSNRIGGLSGPAIKPIALRMVNEVANAVSIPVIGMGGIMTGEDVVEFLLAGASAVMIGTANIANPLASMQILEELKTFMQEEKIDTIMELIGALQ